MATPAAGQASRASLLAGMCRNTRLLGQSGELAPLVEIRFTDSDCQTGAIITQTPATSLSSLTVTPAPIGTLAPNGIRCFGLGVYYAFGAAQTAVQQAQSDQVTWRFVFTGQS